jgi:Tfp pilus assembly protein PilF
MTDVRAKLEAGLRYHQSGNLAAAEQLYRQVLRDQPGNADALYLQGTALRDQGKPQAAVEELRAAIAMRPGYAEAHNNSGIALSDLGRFDETALVIVTIQTARFDKTSQTVGAAT